MSGDARTPALRCAGTPFEVGRQLGLAARQVLPGFLAGNALWRDLQRWRGGDAVTAMMAATEQQFPAIWDELRGMADGLALPFGDVFLWHCRGDFAAQGLDAGCTSAVVRQAGTIWLGHNEDADPALGPLWRLAQVHVTGQPAVWTFYSPGSIPGHAFSANSAGLVQTINNLRPHVFGTGVPRMVLARAVAASATLDAAEKTLSCHRSAGGFHYLLAQAGQSRASSMEVTGESASLVNIGGWYGHTNHMVHPATAGRRQTITASSRDRLSAVRAFLSEDATPDRVLLHRILTDRCSGHPIYRLDRDDPDGENTMVSVIFRIGAHIDVDVLRPPRGQVDNARSGRLTWT